MKYNANDTMALIGEQMTFSILFERPEVMKEFFDVINANVKENSLFSLIEPVDLSDIFTLGYIWGKRDERKRRNKKETGVSHESY